MRLLRHDDDGNHCGIDNQPKLGTGCDGGPTDSWAVKTGVEDLDHRVGTPKKYPGSLIKGL